jgi:hypothetical protein
MKVTWSRDARRRLLSHHFTSHSQFDLLDLVESLTDPLTPLQTWLPRSTGPFDPLPPPLRPTPTHPSSPFSQPSSDRGRVLTVFVSID